MSNSLLQMLAPFCAGQQDPRKELMAPFSYGDWTYATDGAMAVRVPRIDGVADYRTNVLFYESFAHDRICCDQPLELPPPDWRICTGCDGTGVLPDVVPCKDCDGLGYFTHGDHDYDCKNCDESGEIQNPYTGRCDKCLGMKQVDTHGVLRFGKSTFFAARLRLIATLPGLKVCVPEERKQRLYFVFAFGGQGVLMNYIDGNSD